MTAFANKQNINGIFKKNDKKTKKKE